MSYSRERASGGDSQERRVCEATGISEDEASIAAGVTKVAKIEEKDTGDH